MCGEIRTLQVSVREVVPLPSGSVGEDNKKVFAWYMVSKPIFTSARRHFFQGAYAKLNPVFASRCFSTSNTPILLSISCKIMCLAH